MPVLMPGKARSIQPQQVVGVNYDSFLGNGITYCLPLNGNPFEVCRNGRLTYGSAASRGDSYRGTTLKSAGGAACASIPLDLSAYDKATVSFWLYWNSYTNTDLLALEYGANYRTNNGFIVDPSSGAPYSGYFQIGVGANPSSSNNAGYTRPSAAAWHHYMCCFDRSSGATYKQALYVDGGLLTPAGTTTNSIGTNFANNTLYLFSRAGTSLYGAGQMQNLVIRAGILGTAELAVEEYSNPWGIFKPKKIALYFAMGGGPTITINETGAGSEGTPGISVTFGINDTGAGSESYPISSIGSLNDIINSSDALANIFASIPVSQTASGADSLTNLTVIAPVSDNINSSESVLFSTLTSISDNGSFADGITNILNSFFISETGTIVETIYKIAEGFILLNETGHFTETISNFSVSFNLSEAGTVLDSLFNSVYLQVSETSSANDLVNILSATLITIYESGNTVDSLSNVSISFSLTESGSCSDILAITNFLTILDSAGANDVVIKLDGTSLFVQFVLPNRRVDYVLPARYANFILQPRGKLK